jgi:hypothetical protein
MSELHEPPVLDHLGLSGRHRWERPQPSYDIIFKRSDVYSNIFLLPPDAALVGGREEVRNKVHL